MRSARPTKDSRASAARPTARREPGARARCVPPTLRQGRARIRRFRASVRRTPRRRWVRRDRAASRDRLLYALVREQRSRALAQRVFLHLAGRRARKLRDDFEALGPILLRDLTGVEIMLHALEIER